MHDNNLQQLTDTLQSTYQAIYTKRMADMPMVNPSIQVRTVGFQHWQRHIIGILITPWCMNLMCLPGDDEDWSGFTNLTKMKRTFPGGTHEFINSSDSTIGKFQMCSLFSPMFEFASDAIAIETANIIIRELIHPSNPDNNLLPPEPPVTRHAYQAGVDPATSEAEPAATGKSLNQPLSRRQLLRGALHLDGKHK